MGKRDGTGILSARDIEWLLSSLCQLHRIPFDAYLIAAETQTGTGARGNDIIYGESGKDVLDGGAGNDIVLGGADDDSLNGDLNANPADHGDDYLDLGEGLLRQAARGGGGNDIIIGGDTNDTIEGDDLRVGVAADYHGNDYIDAKGGNDTVWGEGGSDVILGGAGNDHLEGDYDYTKNASLLASVTHTLDGQGALVHGYQLSIGSTPSPAIGGNDVIEGGLGDDIVFAGGGDDQVDGGDGADVVFGDGGNDVIQGGIGNDILVGDNYGAGVAYDDDTISGGDDNTTIPFAGWICAMSKPNQSQNHRVTRTYN